MQTLEKPVFLVGAMRSGTTLLADFLGESKHIIHCPFELKDIWSAVGGVEMASPKTRDSHCHELTGKNILPGQREKLTAAFIERMAASDCGKSANAVFLNKNPHLCNKLPLVNAFFPDARFVWIHRQLPCVVSSLLALFKKIHQRQQTWHYWPEPVNATSNRCWHAYHFSVPSGIDMSRCFPGGEVQYLAEYWLESNRAVAQFFDELPTDRQYCIQEEALIENPKEQVEKCLYFLGLPPSLPSDIFERIDKTRNSIWGEQFTDESLQQLLSFSIKNRQTIEAIFRDKRYGTEYLAEISKLLSHQKSNSIKNGETCKSLSKTFIIAQSIKNFALQALARKKHHE